MSAISCGSSGWTPSPEYAPCTREKGHQGPCAHALRPATPPRETSGIRKFTDAFLASCSPAQLEEMTRQINAAKATVFGASPRETSGMAEDVRKRVHESLDKLSENPKIGEALAAANFRSPQTEAGFASGMDVEASRRAVDDAKRMSWGVYGVHKYLNLASQALDEIESLRGEMAAREDNWLADKRYLAEMLIQARTRLSASEKVVEAAEAAISDAVHIPRGEGTQTADFDGPMRISSAMRVSRLRAALSEYRTQGDKT